MNLAQALLNELKSRVYDMKKEVERREEIIAYFEDFDVKDLKSDEITCALSWLNHTTKTADEIIEILEEDN